MWFNETSRRLSAARGSPLLAAFQRCWGDKMIYREKSETIGCDLYREMRSRINCFQISLSSLYSDIWMTSHVTARVCVCVCVGLRRVNHEVCFSEGDGVDLRIFRGSERDRSVRVLTVNLNVTLHLRWRSPGGLWLLLISATRWDKKSFYFLK